jgi:hypothetical protein
LNLFDEAHFVGSFNQAYLKFHHEALREADALRVTASQAR